jgi:c(7)-type cytochrome triheme protein
MSIQWTWLWRCTLGLLLALYASGVSAQQLPRLPKELKLARSTDSPGQVLFDHETHVDAGKPACTPCHPREFRILKAHAGLRPILHANFEKGKQCGACHDGAKAFKVEDDCTNCHRGGSR